MPHSLPKITFKELEREGILYITRAPNKLTCMQQIIAEAQNKELVSIGDNYSGWLSDFEYGGKKLEALAVFSTQAQKGQKKRLTPK